MFRTRVLNRFSINFPFPLNFVHFFPDHSGHPPDFCLWIPPGFLLPRHRDSSPLHFWTSSIFPRLLLGAGNGFLLGAGNGLLLGAGNGLAEMKYLS